MGVNSAGKIVGTATFPDNSNKAYLVDGSQTLDLSAQAGSGSQRSQAAAINDNDEIIWNEFYPSGNTAYLSSGGTSQTVPVPDGYTYITAIAINNSGVVAGNATRSLPNGSGYTAGFSYSKNTGSTSFFSNPPCVAGQQYLTVSTISDSGYVLGQCYSNTGLNTGQIGISFDGTTLTGFTKLHTIVGGIASGDLVGTQWNVLVGAPVPAVLRNGAAFDLGSQISPFELNGVVLKEITRVNAGGWILAGGMDASGYHHAVLLIPR